MREAGEGVEVSKILLWGSRAERRASTIVQMSDSTRISTDAEKNALISLHFM